MIKKLTERDHIVLRPSMYIGSVNLTESEEYIVEQDSDSHDRIVHKKIEFVPGLIKIINEIIDNSVDVAIKTNFEFANQISVKISSDMVEVQDNGTGIPVQKNSDGHYLGELAWGHARAGSNFDDDENRTQIGMNGVGSYSTNCFSKKFIGTSCDGNKTYTIEFLNNAESFTEKVSSAKSSQGVNVKFWPDLEKFGLQEINNVHSSIIKQRLINLSMSFPEITFKFNGKKINVNSFKKYIQMFNETSEIYETEDYKFAILPNDQDDFRQFSYVNGLKIPDGGTHIDIISNSVVYHLREKLSKKYKTIKPGDIRNKLMVVAFLKNVKNTKFNSQSKEKITNSIKEINDYFGPIPFDQLSARILKTPAIIDPITEIYRIKEEFKKRQELKGLQKPVKKIKSDKYLPSIGVKKYLLLVEGECLQENTEILMSDYSIKKIKDIQIGEKIISGDLSEQIVMSKTKLLKESITIRSNTSEITCGINHRLKVYDTKSNNFVFVTAQEIKDDTTRYKLLKSKINSETTAVQVNTNNNFKIYVDEGYISYTNNDYFIIIRNGVIMKIHGIQIQNNDLIIIS